jgi:uncharacterized membrane protein
VLRHLALTLTLATVGQSAFAQAMYRIKPLGWMAGCTSSTPNPRALNNSDEVTGSACISPIIDHAFLWRNNGAPMVDLDPTEPDVDSWGAAINSAGVAVGCGDLNGGSKFIFVSSGDGTPLRKIYSGPKITALCAYAINDLGQLTGTATGGRQGAHFSTATMARQSVLGTLGSNYLERITARLRHQRRRRLRVFSGAVGRTLRLTRRNDGKAMIDLGTLGGELYIGDQRVRRWQGKNYQAERRQPLPFWRNVACCWIWER